MALPAPHQDRRHPRAGDRSRRRWSSGSSRTGVDCFRAQLLARQRGRPLERIRRVRAVEERIGRPIAILADLQGPKLRVGDLPEPIMLETGVVRRRSRAPATRRRATSSSASRSTSRARSAAATTC